MIFILRCDGRRQYIEHAVQSARDFLNADFASLHIVDDSGDAEYAQWLDDTFPDFHILHHSERQGMAAGVRAAFQLASGSDFAFLTEDDFVFTKSVNVKKMARLLHCEHHLAQVSVKRQPWGGAEEAVGGFMEMHPDRYADSECPSGSWVEHSHLFTFNPSLVPLRVAVGLLASEPTEWLEQGITDRLIEQGYRFGVLGHVDSLPRVHHVGIDRSSGYRWTCPD